MIDKALLTLVRGRQKYITEAVILNVLVLICNLCVTAGICWTLSRVLAGEEGRYLPLILSLAGILGRFVCSVLTGDCKAKLGSTVKTDLRRKTYEKILRLGVRSTDDLSMAGLTQVTMEGIEQLDLYYSTYLPQFFYAMIAPFLLFLLCVWLDWRTAVMLLCCVPLIPVSIVAVSRYANKIFAKYWDKYTSMGDGFLDAVQGLRELKIFRADAARNEKMNEQAEEFRRITMKVLVMQLASTTIMDLVAYGGAGAGICFAVAAALRGSASPAVALFLILVSVEFFLPMRSLGSAFHVAMNGASAGKKILKLLETPEPEWGEKTPKSSDLALDDVDFSYDGERTVLKDVSMTFPTQAMTAIVGESGAGKSTVISLLTGTQTPASGTVRLGENRISEFRREDYYRKLAVVSYNTYLFHDTVRANFELANPEIEDSAIWDALRAVNLETFIREAGGLELVISEDAANISGGQRQRLALAVALAADRDIYVFDEATSNIDVESETVIMENVARLSHEKTVIVISHRLANVIPADRIYVLDGGTVAESGTHDELLAHGGAYADMFRAQRELEEVSRRA